MTRYHVWVSQLRTLDVLVEAEDLSEAEGRVRTRPRESGGSLPWLDSATVIRSVLDQTAPDGLRRRDPATFPPSQQLLTTIDAAKYLGISRTTIYGLLKSGDLDSVTIGRSRRVSVAQLQRFLESHD